MKTKAVLFVLFGAVLALAASVATPAWAQATRTWVSGTGDDANPCSRTAPCKTFAGAISKTAAAGEIDCLDPGGFGTLTITKAITIDCGSGETGSTGSILASGTNGINVAAGPNDVVMIKKLSINGTGPTLGPNGIRFVSGKSLLVDNVTLMNFAGFGINMLTSAATLSSLSILNTTLINCVSGGSGAAIQIQPTSAANANVELKSVHMTNNDVGLWAIGTAAGQVQVSVDDTVSSNNNFAGFLAENTNAATNTKMNIIRSTSTNNGSFGIRGNGAGVGLAFGSSLVMGNVHGVKADNGAVVWSYQNNQINQNGDLNAAPSTLGLQ